jgi:nucleotide-binding universal stress UspA family protein
MIRDICVYLDGGKDDDARISAAERLATAFDAYLAGIYINALPEIPATLGYDFGAAEFDALQRAARSKGQTVSNALRTRFAGLGSRTEVRNHDVFESGARDVLVEEARLFDLCVATRPYDHENGNPAMVEAVVFGSGRATLLIPPGGIESVQFETVMVAWQNTREAARAVSEAMPILTRASMVSVCMVGNDDMGGIERAAQGSDIARHLDRHGIKVQLNPVAHGPSIAETLLEEASLAGAGLLVMGAYGHSRLREWMLGGVTRDVLARSPIPILIAH